MNLEFPGTDRFGPCTVDPSNPMPEPDDSCGNFTNPVERIFEPPDDLIKYLESSCQAMGRGHLYGWTAQYNILHPTLLSMGSQDYVDISYLREFNRRGGEIDCHVPLQDQYGFIKGRALKLMTEIPSAAQYFLELMCKSTIGNTIYIKAFGAHAVTFSNAGYFSNSNSGVPS
jgi:hypothetical protein